MRVAFIFVIGLLILAFAPASSSAQLGNSAAVEVMMDQSDLGPDNKLDPETEYAIVPIRTKVTLQAASVCIYAMQLTYHVRSAPPYATVSLNPPVQFFTAEPTTIQPVAYYFESDMIVTITRDAPAFEDGRYEVQVDVQGGQVQGGCNVASSSGVGATTLKNDYLPGLKIGAAEPQPDGTGGYLELKVLNIGNGPTIVRAIVTPDHPHQFAGYSSNEPRLETISYQGESAQDEAILRVDYELAGITSARMKVEVIGAYDGNVADADTEVQTFLVNALADDGIASAAESAEDVPNVPGPGLGSIVVLLAVGVLLRRRAV